MVRFVNVKTDYRFIRALLQPGDLNRRSPSRQGRLWTPLFSLPAAALLRVLRRTDPRLGAPGQCDARIGFDDRQRRAVYRDEYIEMKRGGAWYLIGPCTVGFEGVRYWGRR